MGDGLCGERAQANDASTTKIESRMSFKGSESLKGTVARAAARSSIRHDATTAPLREARPGPLRVPAPRRCLRHRPAVRAHDLPDPRGVVEVSRTVHRLRAEADRA